MTMLINENTIGIWYIHISSNLDWMGYLYSDDDKIKMAYRFRHYDETDPDNDAHSGKDRKSWTYGELTNAATVENAIEFMRSAARHLESLSGKLGMSEEVLMTEAGVDDFMKRLSEKPFAHMKVVPLQ